MVNQVWRTLWLALILCLGLSSVPARFHHHKQSANSLQLADSKDRGGTFPSGSGIREEIPAKYEKRYQAWKTEFLSTESGYAQWQKYAQDTTFVLTITIGNPNRHGGETGKYRWDDWGKLVAATITLGDQLDEGYPNAVYYPVMNSLEFQSSEKIPGCVLAATKIAHEFGHVERMRTTNEALYRTQIKLVPIYNSIFFFGEWLQHK